MAQPTTPIYELPTELLSKIFILVSETDQFGPVKITEVCHRWRDIILDLPRAWSWIYVHTIKKKKNMGRYLSVFTERSHQCVLHIHIPALFTPDYNREMLQEILPSLIQVSHRIQCLSIPSWHLGCFADATFPNLLCLRFSIETEDHVIGVYEFSNKSKYPRLEIFHASYCGWVQSVWDYQKIALPFLKHLSIQASGDDTWVDIITVCAETLVTLTIKGPLINCGIPRVHIRFPILQRLTIDNSFTDYETFCPFEAATPSLVSYEELTGRDNTSEPIHHDLDTVTHLRTDNLRLIPAFPALRVVQCVSVYLSSTEKRALDFVEKVEEDTPYCPTLKLVMFHLRFGAQVHEPALIQRDLNARIERAGRAIKFKFVGPMNLPSLPPRQTPVCGPNLRCRYDQDSESAY